MRSPVPDLLPGSCERKNKSPPSTELYLAIMLPIPPSHLVSVSSEGLLVCFPVQFLWFFLHTEVPDWVLLVKD